VSEIDQGLHAPTKIPKDIKELKDDSPPPSSMGVAGMGSMGGSANGVAGGMAGLGMGTPPPVVAKVNKPTGPMRVSSGTIAGMATFRPEPSYPQIAKQAGVQGVVVLHAIISKQGDIIHLQPVSGPGLLVGAAVAAVSRWKYKPYLLNGEPTEVDTTINVNFTLGND
jgi:protein TonB